MRSTAIACLVVLVTAMVVACGGGTSGSSVALTDGSRTVAPGIAQSQLARNPAPVAVARAAALVDAANLMDWAELRYPQYFPRHRESQLSAPYVYRYYPETNTYLGVDGQ